MKINYILTTFSPAMFGDAASVHIKLIGEEEARRLVTEDTKIVATRGTHERLARIQFPHASQEFSRYASLRDGVNAIIIHYRGPPLSDSGDLPPSAVVSFYLVEVETYQETK